MVRPGFPGFLGHSRQGHSARHLGSQEGWVGDYVRTFAERANGDLLITTYDGRVLAFENNRLAALPSPPGQPGNGYLGAVDESGQCWLAQSRLVVRWSGQEWTAMTLLFSFLEGGTRESPVLTIPTNLRSSRRTDRAPCAALRTFLEQGDALGTFLVREYLDVLAHVTTIGWNKLLATREAVFLRSALAKALRQCCAPLREPKMLLHGKPLGVVATGAFRNGGQELVIEQIQTTMLCFGRVPVGDRPPAFQGGTLLSTKDDLSGHELGLGTARNTGLRVADFVPKLPGA